MNVLPHEKEAQLVRSKKGKGVKVPHTANHQQQRHLMSSHQQLKKYEPLGC